MNIQDLKQELNTMVYNFYWSWNKNIGNFFQNLDPVLWDETKHNPVLLVKKIQDKQLQEKLNQTEFIEQFKKIKQEFTNYMNIQKTQNNQIAYFSAEYGLAESFKIYSGGLGILSGDHCKSASDLNLNFVAVGLFYKQAYFTQQIDSKGNQIAIFENENPAELPMKLVKDENKPIQITFSFSDRTIYAQVWRVNVGRIQLFLLDTDVEENNEFDRKLTYQLYGGSKNREIRLLQEIILGRGGVKLLRQLGYTPSVWHINEGHSAFLIFELIQEEVLHNHLSFDEALKKVKQHILFTTHTPVKEGHENFSIELMKKYFDAYIQSVNISFEKFMQLGNFEFENEIKQFSMTIFALTSSDRANAVSKLNGDVSRKLWYKVWNNIQEEEAPIDYVTNGVHHSTWIGEEIGLLFDEYIGQQWREKVSDSQLWQKIYDVPNEKLDAVHLKAKTKLIEFAKKNITTLYTRNKVEQKIIDKIISTLNPNVLTIGFARRLAPYKRATLIFQNEEKLRNLLNHSKKPVQLFFSGKAHPADTAGQQLLKVIYEYSLKEEFLGKIIILENYSMDIAKYLVSGVDVWLNNPRRPYEASGTSGQKAGMNGVLNCSILDGWWPEAFNGKNGWAIDSADESLPLVEQDKIDGETLHKILSEQVVPLFYDKKEQWISMMKEAIATIVPVYNTHRMVEEYKNTFYTGLMT